MPESAHTDAKSTSEADYDAVVVGASLAGCTSAIMLGRAGARVALVEQRPDINAFKRICSHYIQASAVGTLERIGLLEPMLEAGGGGRSGGMWGRGGGGGRPPGRGGPARGGR